MKKFKEWFGGIMNTKIGVAVVTTIVLSVVSFGGDLFNASGANPIHNKDTIEAVQDSLEVFKDTMQDSLGSVNKKVDKLAVQVDFMADDMQMIKKLLLNQYGQDTTENQ